MNSKTINWEPVARRGKAQPYVLIDSVVDLYRDGYFGKAHGTDWNPKNYRQFDAARWFAKEDLETYVNFLKKAVDTTEGPTLIDFANASAQRFKSYRQFGYEKGQLDYTRLSNAEIADVYADWFEHNKQIWSFAYDYIFTNRFLPDRVVSVIAEKEPDTEKQNQYIALLFAASEPSELRLEKKNLVNIAKLIRETKKHVNDAEIEVLIVKHLEQFAHLGFYYFRGSSYTTIVIKERLNEYLDLADEVFSSLLAEIAYQERENEEAEKLIKKLQLNEKTINDVRSIKHWATLANHGDETYGYVVHQLRGLWREIQRRLSITYEQFYSTGGEEMIAALHSGVMSQELKDRAQARSIDHAIVLENGKKYDLVGVELEAYRKQEVAEEEDFGSITKLKGQPASPGKVTGKVKLVFGPEDVGKVERGDILVASATNPTYVPAMERAKAIVTDEGGLLSHAAVVSRELKVPCVVGTKIGTKLLKDGEFIEVDAVSGVIKLMERSS